MVVSGRIGFSRLEAVVYGQSAAEAVTAEVERLGLDRIFLLTSGTLNRETDEVSKLRLALGDRVVGIFAKMAPHTPRGKVIEAAATVRATNAQLIVTFGGGSVTDAAKAVSLCLANDICDVAGMDILRTQIDADAKSCRLHLWGRWYDKFPFRPRFPLENSAQLLELPMSATTPRNCSAILTLCLSWSFLIQRLPGTRQNGYSFLLVFVLSIIVSREFVR